MNTQVRDGRRAFDVGSIALAVLLALAVALSLSACRDSDVLTDKVVGEVDEYELDETLDPVALENPDASSDISEEEDDSDREDDMEDEDPDYDEDDADTDEETNSQEESDYSQNDSDATSGDSVSDDTSTSSVSDGGEGTSSAPSITFDFTGDSSFVSIADADATTDESGDSGDEWGISSSGGSGASGSSDVTVVQGGSADGYSNMKSSQIIAAAGSIATLVAAIGGGEVLAVCNTDWYDDLPSSAFSNKSELADTVCIDDWGDGSSMADCYKEIAKALPQDGTATVLVDENTFESKYNDYFTDRSIQVVVLEAYGTADVSDDWIADDVEVVAELIGTEDATDRYSDWKSLWTETLQTVRKANGGYSVYTTASTTNSYLYKNRQSAIENESITNVSANLYWTSYVYSMPETTVDTAGLFDLSVSRRYSQKGFYAWPLGSWTTDTSELSIDITDGLGLGVPMSAQGKWSNRSRWATMDYYLQHAGVVNTIGAYNFYSTSTSANSGTVSYTDTSKYEYGNTIVDILPPRILTKNGSSSSTYWSSAGDDDYPFVIAHSAAIASKIVSSAGTADEGSMTVGLCNVGQDYTVAVMPRGISGSWTLGTFESFLMAPYFYCLAQCGGDLSSCDTYVSDFYTQFYRCGASVLTSTSRDRAYGWYGYWVTAEANLG